MLYRSSAHRYRDAVGIEDPHMPLVHNSLIEGTGETWALFVGHFSPFHTSVLMADSVRIGSFRSRRCPHTEPKAHRMTPKCMHRAVMAMVAVAAETIGSVAEDIAAPVGTHAGATTKEKVATASDVTAAC